MARARNLKPGFFLNEDLAKCDPLARLLFAGLWCLADRDGRLEDRPERIKVEVLPYDRCNVENLLDQLAARGFIARYQAAGVRVIQIAKFQKHQSPHKDERSLDLPGPQPDSGGAATAGRPSETLATPPEASGTARDTPDAGAGKPGAKKSPEVSRDYPLSPSSWNHDCGLPLPPKGPAAAGLVSTGSPPETETLATPPEASGTARDTPDARPAYRKAGNRDELFIALAEVTASDPAVSASHIGRVRKALLAADPPYTAADVRRFAGLVPERLPWHKGRISLGLVEKHIGEVRAPSLSPQTPKSEVRRGFGNRFRKPRS